MSAHPVYESPTGGIHLQTPFSSVPAPTPSPSFWDKISTWASENKAVVYTIAGAAVVVTGAGAVYYFSDTRNAGQTSEDRRPSKKERRRLKKEKEDAEKQKENETGLREELPQPGASN